MKAENSENRDCPQRDGAENEGYATIIDKSRVTNFVD